MARTAYNATRVGVSKTRDDIEKLLAKVGVVGFRWGSDLQNSAETIEAALDWKGRHVGFRLTVQYDDEQHRKQVMRALYWYMKSKIEAIEFGLVDLEREFLPYLLTTTGETVADMLEHDERFEIKALPAGGAP